MGDIQRCPHCGGRGGSSVVENVDGVRELPNPQRCTDCRGAGGRCAKCYLSMEECECDGVITCGRCNRPPQECTCRRLGNHF